MENRLLAERIDASDDQLQPEEPATSAAQSVGAPFGDDGVDPRRFFDRRRPRGSGRKSLQLAAQIEETLGHLVAAEAEDLVRNLTLIGVEPIDSKRYLITLGLPGRSTLGELTASMDAVDQVKSGWKDEICRAITRRRAPELVYRVVPLAGLRLFEE